MADKITAIVLSGGRGQRFGGMDKGLVDWRGRPLVAHVIDRLRPGVEQVLISCNRNQAIYRGLADAVVADIEAGFPGPLTGVKAAAPLVKHPFCLLCPNDMPLLPADLIASLLQVLHRDNTLVAYPVCGRRHHFLPALVRREALDTVAEYLASGERSLHRWYRQLGAVSTVDYSDRAAEFGNINTPASLAALNTAGDT